MNRAGRRSGLVPLIGLSVFLLAAIALVGCAGKSNDTKTRAAFLAGQQQALQRMQQGMANVTVLGPVSKPIVTWVNDLTLAKAILEAGYFGQTDPKEILIHRTGQPIQVDPKKLLGGEDIPLQPGDVVEIRL